MMSYADPEAIGFTLILVLVEKVCVRRREVKILIITVTQR